MPDPAPAAGSSAGPGDLRRLEAEVERLRAALVRSELHHQQLLESSRSAIYHLDQEGCFRALNRAALEVLARPASELIGRPFLEVVAPEDRERALQGFGQAAAGEAIEMEVRVLRPSGERRLLRVSRAAVPVEHGADAMIGFAHDVTEERAREMEFRRAERMASVAPLLSGVCHELNNPLTSIKSFAELLLLDEHSEEDREALEIVQREAHRAARIVSDLRVVARQARDAGTGRGPVDLNQLLRAAAERRRCALAAAGVALRCELTPELPAAWASSSQMEQVLQHLLDNAELSLAGQSGQRELILRSHPGEVGVALLVEDTGSGIEPQHLERIFDPFWTTRRPGEGAGLGLALVHAIVADHGGRVRVDSEVGRGTTFTVDLPAAEAVPVALGESDAEAASGRSLRVLVIDDEAPIRYSLLRYLERRGHRVEEAADGTTALRRLEQAPEFDVIVTDLRMPGLGGEQLLEHLRQRGDGLEQRLILITGGDHDSPEVLRSFVGADVPVVQKPFELAEIAQVIEAHADIMSAP